MFGKNNLKEFYDSNPNLNSAEKQKFNKVLREVNNTLFPGGIKKAVSREWNSKNLESLGKIHDAIVEGRKSEKKRKGISVWDFDDTIAYTKSGVRYTLPNPSGKPQPKKKVIFMAGGAGSGKSNVIKQLKLKKQGFKVVNQDISLEW